MSEQQIQQTQEKTNIQQILDNPNPQAIINFQDQKITEVQRELILAKTNLQDMVNYSISLEQKIVELLAELAKYQPVVENDETGGGQ